MFHRQSIETVTMKERDVINIVLIISIMFYVGFAQNIACGDKEYVDNCPSHCPSDYCPRNQYQDTIHCPTPKICPPARCKCGFNYRRAENGTCIPTTSCPPFKCLKPNEEYVSCPFLCPTDSCEDAPLNGVCPFPILILLQCNPKCQCKENYCRENGTCIPYVRKNYETPPRTIY